MFANKQTYRKMHRSLPNSVSAHSDRRNVNQRLVSLSKHFPMFIPLPCFLTLLLKGWQEGEKKKIYNHTLQYANLWSADTWRDLSTLRLRLGFLNGFSVVFWNVPQNVSHKSETVEEHSRGGGGVAMCVKWQFLRTVLTAKQRLDSSPLQHLSALLFNKLHGGELPFTDIAASSRWQHANRAQQGAIVSCKQWPHSATSLRTGTSGTGALLKSHPHNHRIYILPTTKQAKGLKTGRRYGHVNQLRMYGAVYLW